MSVRLIQGGCLEVLAELPEASVHMCVTSPPYWGVRAYGTDPQVWGGDPLCEHAWIEPVTSSGITGGTNQGSKTDNVNGATYRPVPPANSSFCGQCQAWRGELGSEPTPDLFVEHMVLIFRAVRRVLRSDGTLWLNLGDSYNNRTRTRVSSHQPGLNGVVDGSWAERAAAGGVRMSRTDGGLKEKDLCMIPARVALALQVDGWWLRSVIIWSKPNPMPESVTDRPTTAHEYVFLLSPSATYYYDQEAVREPNSSPEQLAHNLKYARPYAAYDDRASANGQPGNVNNVGIHARPGAAGRNRRTVWEIPTQPTPEAHFATFPEKLVEPCILAGTSEAGVCARCGSPWLRQTEPSAEAKARTGAGWHDHQDDALRGQRGVPPPLTEPARVTVGWQPSCHCDVSEPAPATVLDCFGGSGTTGRVAERLGRNSILVELNPDYITIAQRRTAQRSLLTWSGEESAS